MKQTLYPCSDTGLIERVTIAEGCMEKGPAIRRQLANQDYFLKRDLPPPAKSCREDFHLAAPGAFE